MNCIKNILTSLVVAGAATLSLTFAVSAATAEPQSTNTVTWTTLENGYWYASEKVDDISEYHNSFRKGDASKLTVSFGPASFSGINGHEGNYKTLTVTLIKPGGERDTDYKTGTDETLTAKPNVSTPYLNATYFCKILDGTGDRSKFLEGYYFKLESTNI